MDIVCFYIISYTIINCITTVYRIYRANAIVVAISSTVRIEHIVTVKVRVVHIAQAEIRISRIAVSITRSQPD